MGWGFAIMGNRLNNQNRSSQKAIHHMNKNVSSPQTRFILKFKKSTPERIKKLRSELKTKRLNQNISIGFAALASVVVSGWLAARFFITYGII